jgi:acetyl esterase/lipase
MGFAVANIEYRLTGQATAPAAIEDTRCALIYLIKNAKELNIDVNKIVIMGGSAGGHLALMGGLLANDHRFDANCPGFENVKVAAIIDKYGISDVWDWGYGPVIKSRSAKSWLGKYATDEKFAKSVSPIYYVNKNSPPVFIVHGDADPTVPYQQSVDLHKKLIEAGVKTEFITVEGGLHGKFEKEKNSEINKAMMEFIKSTPSFKEK